MPAQVIASAGADGPLTGHWNWSHHLAAVAAQHCQKHLTPLPLLIGGVACGGCWETAIRDDERFAVECGLPREVTAEPDYVDEIAVDLAMRGRKVELTELERTEVRRRLAEIRNRRNRGYRFVCSRAAAARREAQR